MKTLCVNLSFIFQSVSRKTIGRSWLFAAINVLFFSSLLFATAAAQNVNVNGDNPTTAGTNRNLTIMSDAVSTTTFTSVIRIALSTLITSGDNDVVKNCIITGSATGRNVAAATSQAGSEFTTYGILVG